MFERGPQGRSVRSLVWQNKTMTNDVCHLMQQRQGDVYISRYSETKYLYLQGRREKRKLDMLVKLGDNIFIFLYSATFLYL
jgi:hypothetical protein